MPRTTRQIGEVSANPEAFNLVRAILTHHDEFDVDIKFLGFIYSQIQLVILVIMM